MYPIAHPSSPLLRGHHGRRTTVVAPHNLITKNVKTSRQRRIKQCNKDLSHPYGSPWCVPTGLSSSHSQNRKLSPETTPYSVSIWQVCAPMPETQNPLSAVVVLAFGQRMASHDRSPFGTSCTTYWSRSIAHNLLPELNATDQRMDKSCSDKRRHGDRILRRQDYANGCVTGALGKRRISNAN